MLSDSENDETDFFGQVVSPGIKGFKKSLDYFSPKMP